MRAGTGSHAGPAENLTADGAQAAGTQAAAAAPPPQVAAPSVSGSNPAAAAAPQAAAPQHPIAMQPMDFPTGTPAAKQPRSFYPPLKCHDGLVGWEDMKEALPNSAVTKESQSSHPGIEESSGPRTDESSGTLIEAASVSMKGKLALPKSAVADESSGPLIEDADESSCPLMRAAVTKESSAPRIEESSGPRIEVSSGPPNEDAEPQEADFAGSESQKSDDLAMPSFAPTPEREWPDSHVSHKVNAENSRTGAVAAPWAAAAHAAPQAAAAAADAADAAPQPAAAAAVAAAAAPQAAALDAAPQEAAQVNALRIVGKGAQN